MNQGSVMRKTAEAILEKLKKQVLLVNQPKLLKMFKK